jgi:hypothetical protein
MISEIIKWAVGFFSSGVGQSAGKVVTVGAIAAAITPLILWYYNGGKDEQAVCYTYGQIFFPAFFGCIGVAIAYLTRSGSVQNRSEYKD